ncbi:MAG: GxGYxYP domain-containing protein [Promethearchaeota archaeon]
MKINSKKHATLVFLIVLTAISLFLSNMKMGASATSGASGSIDQALEQGSFAQLSVPMASKSVNFSVVDVRGWNLDFKENYLLSSLEGIVNHDGARLYVIDGNVAENWLNELDESFYNASKLNVSSLSGLLDLYADKIEGFIIWDDLPESGNVATPLCGVYNSILIHSGLYSEAITWPALASKPLMVNLTLEYQKQGFNDETDKADIYKWAFDTYFTQCNQTALGMYDNQNAGAIRSQLCGDSIFTFWQPMFCDQEKKHPDSTKQVDVFEYILQNTPQNVIVYGYMYPDGCNEHPVVSRLTENGKYLVPSDWFGHAPFWERLPIPENFTFEQSSSRDTTSIPIENKIYVAGIYSDGDNMQYVANFMKENLWDGHHGTVPTTFELTPTIVKLAPAMAMIFYSEMTSNDYFVTGVGGKGYAKTSYASERFSSIYWKDTRELMSFLDQREIRSWQSGDIRNIINIMNNEDGKNQVDAFIEGYGGSNYYFPTFVKNIPYIKMIGYSAQNSSDYEDEKQILLNLLKYKNNDEPMFVVLHLLCWSSPYDTWADFVHDISKESNDKIVFVTAGQLSNLIVQSGLARQGINTYTLNAFISFASVAIISLLIIFQPKLFQKIRRYKK